MNRRHFLISSTAALALMACGIPEAKAKTPYTPPTLVKQPMLLVGRGLDDLDDVLHGHVDLALLHNVRLDRDDYESLSELSTRKGLATPITCSREFNTFPAEEQAQMLTEVDDMLRHLMAQGYIHVSDDPYGDVSPSVRKQQQARWAKATAWEDAVYDTAHRWIRA